MTNVMPNVEVGSHVLLASLSNPARFWYVGTVTKLIGKRGDVPMFEFKVYDAYNDEMRGSHFIGYADEVEASDAD